MAITDFDKRMTAAVTLAFPDTQQQLCIHHINSNVLLRAKRHWKDEKETPASEESDKTTSSTPEQSPLTAEDQQAITPSQTQSLAPDESVSHDYQGVLDMWRLVVFAETKEEHDNAWLMLCKEFDDQGVILSYLYRTYLPVREQWARCIIRGYRNFGVRVTSGIEASNNKIKSYLLNGITSKSKRISFL